MTSLLVESINQSLHGSLRITHCIQLLCVFRTCVPFLAFIARDVISCDVRGPDDEGVAVGNVTLSLYFPSVVSHGRVKDCCYLQAATTTCHGIIANTEEEVYIQEGCGCRIKRQIEGNERKS